MSSLEWTGRLSCSEGKFLLPLQKKSWYSRVKVNCLFRVLLLGSLAVAQDLTEDEETVEDSIIEDEDDEAEVEEDEPTDLVSAVLDLLHVYNVFRIYPFYRQIWY